MQPSLIGLLVCLALLVPGRMAGGPLLVAMIASFAFGSTALMTLTALGGASPLIYVFFSLGLLVVVATRRTIWGELGRLFARVPSMWLLILLCVYVLVGGLLFPRLFAGQTSVFVVAASRAGIVESTLAPVSGNISQSGYLVVNALTAIALGVILLGRDRTDLLRRGFFLFAGLNLVMGYIDLAAKTVGAGDVLAFLRTANFAMLSEQEMMGLARLNGPYPEPSSFAAASLACLGFTYAYWRRTGSVAARWITVGTLLLLLRSTSSTAYAGLAVLAPVVLFGFLRSALSGRVGLGDVWVLVVSSVSAVALFGLVLASDSALKPATDVLDAALFRKASSASGEERLYWNTKSLESVAATSGMGIGVGSSRASSWPIAAVSQLGIAGSVIMALLLAAIVRGLGRYEPRFGRETSATVAGVRAAALAGLVAASLTSGAPDPGLTFFIAFATIATMRARAAGMASEPAGAALAPRVAAGAT